MSQKVAAVESQGNISDTKHAGPAESLLGTVLEGRWTVTERLFADPGIKSRSRRSCYKAIDKTSRPAFVKAFDFRHDDINLEPEELDQYLREFLNEASIHEHCKGKKLSRVTRLIAKGKIIVDGQAVHYLVLEWGAKSLRQYHPPGDGNVSLHTRLIGLRDVASALKQLHNNGIAHQDIKPSNVLHVERSPLKLTDLGCTSCQGFPAPPHDFEFVPGQPNYAPYELLYESEGLDWRTRRFGNDIFLLGNLIYTSFVGTSVTILVLHYIDRSLRPRVHGGPYSDVIPYLIEAHAWATGIILPEHLPSGMAAELSALVAGLCHPDPKRRGCPRSISKPGSQYDLQRVVSRLDIMATKARLNSI